MKNIKLIVFIIIMFSFLPACDNHPSSRADKPSGDGKAEINILFVQSWGEDVNGEFRRIVNDWATTSDVKANLEIVPIKEMDIKLTAWINAPSGDLALLPTNIAMVNTGKITNITSLSNEIERKSDGFYNIGESMAKFGDSWFNIPFCAWPHIWFYRLDLLKGINGKVPTTFNEAENLFELIKNKYPDIYPLGIGLGQDEDLSMFLQTLLWAYGSSVVAEDGKTITLDSPNTIDAFKYMLRLYKKGFIPPGALAWDGASNNNAFLAKKVAITSNALSIDYVAKRNDPDLYSKIIHSEYPAGPQGKFSFVQTFGWAIKKETQNYNEISDFLNFLYDSKRLSELFSVGEGAIAPLMKSVGETDAWKNGRYADAIASVETAKPLGWPGPFSKQAAEVYNQRILNNTFSYVINEKLSVEEAVSKVSDLVKEIYEKK